VDEARPRVARAMMWTALGLIFLIRLFTGMTHGWSAGALLLAMASYPPLVVLLARRWPVRVRYGLFGLVVHSETAAIPDGIRRFAARLHAPLQTVWLDGRTQFDFYDDEPTVTESIDHAARHLHATL